MTKVWVAAAAILLANACSSSKSADSAAPALCDRCKTACTKDQASACHDLAVLRTQTAGPAFDLTAIASRR